MRLGVLDLMFLAGESRESMMHVGGLLLFSPPPDAAPGFLRELADELRAAPTVEPPWNLRLRTPTVLKNPLNDWIEDPAFDLDYHVRRSALPSPGDERELGILVSRLHSHPIDFHRPPWEVHFIEGLERGRFALYFKVHHALLDGYTGMRVLSKSLSRRPDDRDAPMFYARAVPRGGHEGGATATLGDLLALARHQRDTMRDVGRAFRRVLRSSPQHDPQLIDPREAPRSILNRRISRNRRFATQQFAIDRLRRLAGAVGGTLNDVVLALCGAALRRLLLDLDALPAEPLVAMVPVNVRPKDDPGGGNALGAILASLATDLPDARARLDAIVASTGHAKAQLQGMSRGAILQYSALLLAPMLVQQLPGMVGLTPPAFNVVISNMPGPSEPLYFRGAALEAVYAASIPFPGYGLNITIASYVDTLNFGFTGCRETVPHLQRLAVYAADALEELERTVP
jgi:WS/DGAT/MGAT family acyltransferase